MDSKSGSQVEVQGNSFKFRYFVGINIYICKPGVLRTMLIDKYTFEGSQRKVSPTKNINYRQMGDVIGTRNIINKCEVQG